MKKLFKILGISLVLIFGFISLTFIFPYFGKYIFGGPESARRWEVIQDSHKYCQETLPNENTLESDYDACLKGYLAKNNVN